MGWRCFIAVFIWDECPSINLGLHCWPGQEMPAIYHHPCCRFYTPTIFHQCQQFLSKVNWGRWFFRPKSVWFMTERGDVEKWHQMLSLKSFSSQPKCGYWLGRKKTFYQHEHKILNALMSKHMFGLNRGFCYNIPHLIENNVQSITS